MRIGITHAPLKLFLRNFMKTKFIFLTLFITLLLFPQKDWANDSEPVTFVGSDTCINCHQQEYNAWQGSHHEQSMQHATEASILANFDNVSFDSNGLNRFYIREFKQEQKNSENMTQLKKEFWVNIKGADGEHHDYQIKYTFGVTPLQQYMVEFDDGRIQLIPFAWDSRPISEGGQRWFNLYPEMAKPQQTSFWTNAGQNWNYMCADCHSTNLSKNFNINTNTYDTSFSEINVACESCHGAASKHLAWTSQRPENSPTTIKNNNKGFTHNLSKSVKSWQIKDNKKTLMPKEVKNSQQVLVCAQCHSRRTQISNQDHVKSNAFGDRYLLDLLSSNNYHPDGQVNNEDFVYGSFLQSKMFKEGVVCTDCHNPHTAELKLPVDVLCLQCHQPDNYASKQHHQHEPDSEGAQCVNCHMPETTYMKVDARRDHGFHIPTPDLAKQLGTPDTCLSCHKDKDSEWSANKVNAWYPNSIVKEEKAFAPIFSASNIALNEQQLRSVTNELSRISQSTRYAAIIRASALAKMARLANGNSMIAITQALKNSDENIRLGAIEASQNLPAKDKWRILSPSLKDPVLAVRTNAAFALTSLWQNLSVSQRDQLTPALEEYIASQHFNNDRSFAHSNMGVIAAYQGKYEQAIKNFKLGISIEKHFVQTYLNLSQLYYQGGENQKSIITLQQGKKANPDDASLPYHLGLAYIRMKDTNKASSELSLATQLAPQNSHYFYVYGLSLESIEPNAAYKALYQAFSLSNNPQHLYALCEMKVRHKSPQIQQCLDELAPLVSNKVIQALKQRQLKL